MKPENRFDDVRKRAVSDVVQQRRAAHGKLCFAGNLVAQIEFRQNPRRQMKRAQRMCKARMFRRLISKMRESELADSPQALKFRRIDETRKKPSFRRIGLQTNDIVNRIAVNFL